MAAALIRHTLYVTYNLATSIDILFDIKPKLSDQSQISELEGQVIQVRTDRCWCSYIHRCMYLGWTSRSGKSNPAWYAELLLIVQIDYKEDISQSLRDFSYFQSQVSALQPCSLGTIQDFFCKFSMKLFMHLVKIVSFFIPRIRQTYQNY